MPTKKHITLKIILFLFFTDFLETFAQYCFKKSAILGQPLAFNTLNDGFQFVALLIASPFLWMALFSIFVIFISWAAILSKIDLSVAVPVASLSYIGVPVLSKILLHEQISFMRWFGVCFILAGVILVSMSSRHKRKN